MKSVPFSGLNGDGQFFFVDDDDYERVSERRWYLASSGYVTPAVHRFLMQPSKREVVDHIDGDPLNNQRSNLRVCTPRQNSWNNHARAARVTGVRRGTGDYWTANIKTDGVVTNLGQFTTRAAAFKAYRAATVHRRGEFSPHGACHLCVTTGAGVLPEYQSRGTDSVDRGGHSPHDLCLWCSRPRHLSEDPASHCPDAERNAA